MMPYNFILTGGPCGLKTTCLKAIKPELKKLGYKSFFIPEVPTLLMNMGIHPADIGMIEFQKYVLPLQMKLEQDVFKVTSHFLSQGIKSVVFMDRSLMDPIAYIGNSNDTLTYNALLKEILDIEIHQVFDPYDTIVHLRTAAYGAEEHFTQESIENDTKRDEGLEKARILDDRLIQAYSSHSDVVVLDNVIVEEKINKEKKIEMFINLIKTKLDQAETRSL